jgi:MFS family permease
MSDPLFTPAFLRLMGAQALQSIGYASMILLPRYLDALGARRADIGVVMAASAIGGLVTRPVVGAALDRLGRRPTLAVGTAALAAGMMAFGFVTALGPLALAASALVGVGTGTLFTGYFTLASDLVPASRRTEGLALFGIAGLFPLIVNPLAARAGVDPLDIRWFLPAIGLLVASSLLLLRGVPEPPRRAALPEVGGTGRALLARPLWGVWVANAVFSALVASFMSFALVIADHRHLPDPADVWFAYAFAAVGVRVGGARLPDRLGGGLMLAAALLAYVGGVAALALAQDRLTLLLAGGLCGVGHGWCFPILTSQVVTRTPPDRRGAAMATFTGLWDLTKLLAPPALGVVADALGDAAMLQVAVGLALVGCAAWAALEARLNPSDRIAA